MNKYKRGFVGIAPIIIFLIVAIGVLIFFANNNSAIKVENSNPATSSATTIVAGETTNWKTYTDKENGFSFKYPSDWTFEKAPQGGLSMMAARKLPDYEFFVNVSPYPYGKDKIEKYTDANHKLIFIDNHKALLSGGDEYVPSTPSREDSISVVIETTPFPSPSKIVSLSMDSNNQNQDMRTIFFNIISTFTFTNN